MLMIPLSRLITITLGCVLGNIISSIILKPKWSEFLRTNILLSLPLITLLFLEIVNWLIK